MLNVKSLPNIRNCLPFMGKNPLWLQMVPGSTGLLCSPSNSSFMVNIHQLMPQNSSYLHSVVYSYQFCNIPEYCHFVKEPFIFRQRQVQVLDSPVSRSVFIITKVTTVWLWLWNNKTEHYIHQKQITMSMSSPYNPNRISLQEWTWIFSHVLESLEKHVICI